MIFMKAFLLKLFEMSGPWETFNDVRVGMSECAIVWKRSKLKHYPKLGILVVIQNSKELRVIWSIKPNNDCASLAL